MPTQNIDLSAQVTTTSLSQTITANYNTGGNAINYTQQTSGVLINNNGPATAQYSVDNGPWVVLDKREANYLPVDLSVNRVSVKLINDGSTSTKIDVLVESAPTFYIGPSGEQFPVANPPARVNGYRYSGEVATAVPGAGYAFTAGQWYRDGVAISGQTALTYTRINIDVGTALTFIPTGVPFLASGGTTLQNQGNTTVLGALMPTAVSAPFTGTQNLMMSMPGEFYEVAALAINYDTTAPFVIDNLAFAVSERSDTSKTVPIINGTNYNVTAAAGTQLGFVTGTWDGSASVSVPAAKFAESKSGVVIPSYQMSDWTPLSSIPRVDTPTAFPLLICRQFWNARAISQFNFANATDVDALNTAMAPYEFYQVAQGTTNGVSAPSAFTATWALGTSTLSGRILALAVRLRGTIGQFILIGGDSIHQGIAANGDTNPNKPANNWNGFQGRTVKALASKARPVGALNISFSGMRSADFQERLMAAIPVLRPTIVSSPVFTPNDPGPGTDATFSNQLSRALALNTLAKQYQAKPLFCTGTPGGGAGYTQQLAFTNQLKSDSRLDVIDIFTPLSDANNPAQDYWTSSAYFDGTHPTNAGHITASTSAALPKYLALIGPN